jgi:hypothetical protein
MVNRQNINNSEQSIDEVQSSVISASVPKALANAKRCYVEMSNLHLNKSQELKAVKLLGEAILSPEIAIPWCVEHHLPEFAESTWRTYRSGYRMILEKAFTNKNVSADVYAETLKKLENAKAKKKKVKRRCKELFSSDELKKIADDLTAKITDRPCSKYKSSRWVVALLSWLQANVLVGLNPQEWNSVLITGKTIDEMVFSFTATSRDPNKSRITKVDAGGRTYIDLSNMTKDQKWMIVMHSRLIRAYKNKRRFDELYNECRRLLHSVNKKLWPKRKINITLTSGCQDWSKDQKYLATPVSIKDHTDKVKGEAAPLASKVRTKL